MENFEHIRHILFYYFKKGKKATEAREKLRRVYEMSSKNASARTDLPDSVMVIFQSKTLIAPSKIDDMIDKIDEMKGASIQRFGNLLLL